MPLFNKDPKTTAPETPKLDEHFKHIAFIMDGNGRWAKKRGMPREYGHKVGSATFKKICIYCCDIGFKAVTVYAFSTENWKRSKEEVSGIMKLLGRYMKEVLMDMEKNGVCFRFFGDLSRLSPDLQKICREVEERSSAYHEVQVNFCLNYGGRDEIVRAARTFAQEVAEGKRQPEELTEELLSSYLYSADIPDPELIIRPSGEMRTSNFLLWQSAYSEFVFMNVLWPDFGPKELDEAIAEYHRRNRRFGGV